MDISLMSVDICLGNEVTTSTRDSSGVPFRLAAMSVPVSFELDFELDVRGVAEPLRSPPATALVGLFSVELGGKLVRVRLFLVMVTGFFSDLVVTMADVVNILRKVLPKQMYYF